VAAGHKVELLGPIDIVCVDQLSTGQQSEYLLRLTTMNQAIDVQVVRRRRKTMAIYVEKDVQTQLRVPTNCPWSDIHQFLRNKFDWVLRAQRELASREVAPANVYENGGEISFLGKRYQLELTKSRYRIVERGDNTLYVSCTNPGSCGAVEKQVLDWYRREAEQLFSESIEAVNPLFNDSIRSKGLSIRKMKARWGSCSSNGDICLNLLLVKEAPPQIDFVVAHELCHLRHFAHNNAFYGLLDAVMPDWRGVEALLGRAV
jgi:predicted metal-dependent hydrolase